MQSTSHKGLYIGMTSDLRRRFAQHQNNEAPATARRGPWTIIYYEAYRLRSDAEGREKFLKSGAGHVFLDKQIKGYFANSPRKRSGE